VSTDFSTWPLKRLTDQRQHLESILLLAAGQDDPLKPRLRDELKAIREEIGSRAAEDADR
jgi:hypothetical protein